MLFVWTPAMNSAQNPSQNPEQPMPLLFEGQAGSYFGADYGALPEALPEPVLAVGRSLAAQGLIYCGKLTGACFAQIEVYGYRTDDERTAISVMVDVAGVQGGLQGVDCVSRFADGSFLTTTTTNVVAGAYDDQGLFRISYPGLSVSELLAQHQVHLVAYEQHCGEAQAVFGDLLAIARMVDEYTMRQESSSGHGFLQVAGGLVQAGLAHMMGGGEEDWAEQDDDGLKDGILTPTPIVLGDNPRETNALTEKLGDMAMYGKLAQVQELVEAGAEVNGITECGKSPLMLAAMYGHIPVMALLLDAEADPNLGSDEEFEEGQTALMYAVSSFWANNRAEVVAFLISRGADVNLQDEEGQTALMAAGENTDAVKALIEAGADVDLRDREGNTAMMLGTVAVQQLLTQAGASQEGLNDVALVEAAALGDVAKVDALLGAGANVNYGDGGALVAAAGKGNVVLLERLIGAGADVNLGWRSGLTAIAQAAYEGYLEVVEILLKAGADPYQRTHDEEFEDALGYARIGQREGHHKGEGHAAIIELLQR